MSQQNAPRRVKKHQQMTMALDLGAAGATYRRIGEQLSVSKTRAFHTIRARWMNWCSIAKS
jgi:hypothetical protein